MVNDSILEKLKIFVNIVRSNDYVIYLVPILIVMAIMIILSCKAKDNVMKFFYIIIYLSGLGFAVYKYYDYIIKILDYLVEVIVSNILFPNLAIYISVFLIINLVVLWTLFSKNVKSYVRNINIVSFVVMQLFLYLIIENVVANKINIYEKLSIYTNHNLLVLIELSMQLFVVWMCVLLITKFIDHLINYNGTKKNSKPVTTNTVIECEENNSDNYYDDDYYNNDFIEYVPIKKAKL